MSYNNVGSSAHLRDTIRRLKVVRAKCGKKDDMDDDRRAGFQSGDDFRDECSYFFETIKMVKEQISDRNNTVRKYGDNSGVIEQSHEINYTLRDLEAHLGKIKLLTEDADRELAKANSAKKKKADKIALRERELLEKREACQSCEGMMEAVREMNQQRLRGHDLSKNTRISQKNALRDQLSSINKSNRQRNGLGGEGFGVGDGDESGSGEGGRLEDDPENAQRVKVMADQEQRIDAGLTQLRTGVGRLHQIAELMGTELDSQNKHLDKTDTKVEHETKRIIALNDRLASLLKGQTPFNVVLHIAMIGLLVGILGYILYSFGVVPN